MMGASVSVTGWVITGVFCIEVNGYSNHLLRNQAPLVFPKEQIRINISQ